MSAATDLLWKLECRINRRLPFTPRADRLASFTPQGATTDVIGGARPALSGPPALCVVVITHARVELCGSLLESIRSSLADAGLEQQSFVLVIEDTSECDYAPVLERLARDFAGRFAFYESSRWLGKRARAGTYQAAFHALRALRPLKALFIEDDMMIERSFVREALARWDEVDDPRKLVLYLTSFDDDEARGRWVRFMRKPVPGTGLRLTQWFDLSAFLVDARFFELLRYEVFTSFRSRWWRDPGRSCGISEQFTLRLFGRGNVYQVDSTLAFHGKGPSLLNPEARVKRPLDNRRTDDGG